MEELQETLELVSKIEDLEKELSIIKNDYKHLEEKYNLLYKVIKTFNEYNEKRNFIEDLLKQC